MGFVGAVIRFVVRRALLLGIFIAIVLLVPGLPPHCTFTPIELAPTLARQGVLAHNNALGNANKLFADQLYGPETFQVHNGALYTTLGTGEVVKLSSGGLVTFVTKIGIPCEGIWQEHKCGRPLGFRIDDAGKYLYIADAYYGIWKVDLRTDKKELLVSPRANIEGVAPKIFNGIALAKNGDLYWTDSSSDFYLKDGSYTTLVDPSGRLFHYNAARNQSRVLINGLWFANGVALSPNEEFVIVNECLASRVHRIYVKGPKAGQKDIFLDGLPGTPDNIQPLTDGSGVLIALYKVFDESHPLISRSTARFPLFRKFIARLLRLFEVPFEFLNEQFPNVIFEKLTYTIGHFNSMTSIAPKASGLLQVDWNGNIVGAWFNEDGSANSISDAIVFQNQLYLGSPHTPFLATVPVPEKLKLAFTQQKMSPPTKVPGSKKDEVKKPVEKPTSTEAPAVKKTAEPMKSEPTKPPVVEKSKPKVEQAKPATEKPATKPVTDKPTTVKPVTEKPTSPKPSTEKSATPKPTTEKPAAAKLTPDNPPKPAVQQPKPIELPKATTPKPPPVKAELPKKTEAPKKPEAPKKDTQKEVPKPSEQQKVKKEEIPIVEEIKVDTTRPTKEPLKVIKREGPVEIPHPEL